MKEKKYREINGKLYVEACLSSSLIEGKGKQIVFHEDDDMQLAIFKIDGNLYCLDNICPHRHQDKIFEGIILKKEMTIMCPLHAWTYSIVTGENVNKRQGIKSLKKYDIFEEDGKIFVEKPLLNIPKWRR